jgi:hypothetical protein
MTLHHPDESIKDHCPLVKDFPYIWSSVPSPLLSNIYPDLEHPGQATRYSGLDQWTQSLFPGRTQQTQKEIYVICFLCSEISYICFSSLHSTDFPSLRDDGLKT